MVLECRHVKKKKKRIQVKLKDPVIRSIHPVAFKALGGLEKMLEMINHSDLMC